MQKSFYWLIPLILLGLFLGGKYFYFKPKYVNGELAQDFQTKLIDGEDFALSDLRGHYVILDFWGSWCGPCRVENPALVALYDSYRGKKFKDGDELEVVSVSIETNADSWKRAIQKDNLHWKYHISELQRFKSPIVMQYGVREIPTKYLLNPKGQIIGVNQSFQEIDKVLSERLK